MSEQPRVSVEMSPQQLSDRAEDGKKLGNSDLQDAKYADKVHKFRAKTNLSRSGIGAKRQLGATLEAQCINTAKYGPDADDESKATADEYIDMVVELRAAKEAEISQLAAELNTALGGDYAPYDREVDPTLPNKMKAALVSRTVDPEKGRIGNTEVETDIINTLLTVGEEEDIALLKRYMDVFGDDASAAEIVAKIKAAVEDGDEFSHVDNTVDEQEQKPDLENPIKNDLLKAGRDDFFRKKAQELTKDLPKDMDPYIDRAITRREDKKYEDLEASKEKSYQQARESLPTKEKINEYLAIDLNQTHKPMELYEAVTQLSYAMNAGDEDENKPKQLAPDVEARIINTILDDTEGYTGDVELLNQYIEHFSDGAYKIPSGVAESEPTADKREKNDAETPDSAEEKSELVEQLEVALGGDYDPNGTKLRLKTSRRRLNKLTNTGASRWENSDVEARMIRALVFSGQDKDIKILNDYMKIHGESEADPRQVVTITKVDPEADAADTAPAAEWHDDVGGDMSADEAQELFDDYVDENVGSLDEDLPLWITDPDAYAAQRADQNAARNIDTEDSSIHTDTEDEAITNSSLEEENQESAEPGKRGLLGGLKHLFRRGGRIKKFGKAVGLSRVAKGMELRAASAGSKVSGNKDASAAYKSLLNDLHAEDPGLLRAWRKRRSLKSESERLVKAGAGEDLIQAAQSAEDAYKKQHPNLNGKIKARLGELKKPTMPGRPKLERSDRAKYVERGKIIKAELARVRASEPIDDRREQIALGALETWENENPRLKKRKDRKVIKDERKRLEDALFSEKIGITGKTGESNQEAIKKAQTALDAFNAENPRTRDKMRNKKDSIVQRAKDNKDAIGYGLHARRNENSLGSFDSKIAQLNDQLKTLDPNGDGSGEQYDQAEYSRINRAVTELMAAKGELEVSKANFGESKKRWLLSISAGAGVGSGMVLEQLHQKFGAPTGRIERRMVAVGLASSWLAYSSIGYIKSAQYAEKGGATGSVAERAARLFVGALEQQPHVDAFIAGFAAEAAFGSYVSGAVGVGAEAVNMAGDKIQNLGFDMPDMPNMPGLPSMEGLDDMAQDLIDDLAELMPDSPDFPSIKGTLGEIQDLIGKLDAGIDAFEEASGFDITPSTPEPVKEGIDQLQEMADSIIEKIKGIDVTPNLPEPIRESLEEMAQEAKDIIDDIKGLEAPNMPSLPSWDRIGDQINYSIEAIGEKISQIDIIPDLPDMPDFKNSWSEIKDLVGTIDTGFDAAIDAFEEATDYDITPDEQIAAARDKATQLQGDIDAIKQRLGDIIVLSVLPEPIQEKLGEISAEIQRIDSGLEAAREAFEQEIQGDAGSTNAETEAAAPVEATGDKPADVVPPVAEAESPTAVVPPDNVGSTVDTPANTAETTEPTTPEAPPAETDTATDEAAISDAEIDDIDEAIREAGESDAAENAATTAEAPTLGFIEHTVQHGDGGLLEIINKQFPGENNSGAHWDIPSDGGADVLVYDNSHALEIFAENAEVFTTPENKTEVSQLLGAIQGLQAADGEYTLSHIENMTVSGDPDRSLLDVFFDAAKPDVGDKLTMPSK